MTPREQLRETITAALVGAIGPYPPPHLAAALEAAAVDYAASHAGTPPPCCDLHGRNCEPPGDLCCENCTEARHVGWEDSRGVMRYGHPAGETCSSPDLSPNSLAEAAKIDAAVAAERQRATREHVAEQDAVHADLAALLRALGMFDGARPESPHEVMQMAISEVARLRAAERERIASWLKRAAAGRREYAERGPDDKVRARLELAAACCESAAQLITDPDLMLDVIPSWRWTPDEVADLYRDPQ